jgi:hypothetical protein
MGVKAKSAPAVFGVNSGMIAPFGKYTTPNRWLGLAAALAEGVSAGNMASRRGSERAVPTPRRIVRRDSDFFETNIYIILIWQLLREI